MRIRFTRDVIYDTGGPGIGPKFAKGSTLSTADVGLALGMKVVPEGYADAFLNRWVQRQSAEEIRAEPKAHDKGKAPPAPVAEVPEPKAPEPEVPDAAPDEVPDAVAEAPDAAPEAPEAAHEAPDAVAVPVSQPFGTKKRGRPAKGLDKS